MRRLLAPLTALVLPSPSRPPRRPAGSRAEPVDGPAEIDALGDVDVARDGSGGARLPQARRRRAAGLPLAPGRGRLAAAGEALERRAGHRGGRDARPTAAGWPSRGSPAAQVLGDRDPGGRAGPGARARRCCWAAAARPACAIDMGINEDGYAVWSAGGDVRAARLDGTAWTPLAGAAGRRRRAHGRRRARSRPRVGRQRRGQRRRHLGRRPTRTGAPRHRAPPHRPDAVLVPAGPHAGRLRGRRRPAAPTRRTSTSRTTARSPGSRSARTSAGARAPSRGGCAARCSRSPFAIDGGVTSSGPADRLHRQGHRRRGRRRPRATPSSAPTWTSSTPSSPAARHRRDAERRRARRRWSRPPSAATSTWPGAPAPATSGDVRARRKDGEKGFEPEFLASNPEFGAVAPGQLAIGADRSGNTVVAMLQGAAPGAGITAAVYDRAARRARSCSSSIRYRARRPLIKWTGRLGELGRADVHRARRRQGGRHDHRATRLVSPTRARQGPAPLPGAPRPTAAARSSRSRTRTSASTRACRRCGSRSRRSGPPRDRLAGRERPRAGRAGLRRRSTGATASRKLRRRSARRTRYKTGRYTLTVTRGRQGRQPDRQEQGPADPVTPPVLRAAGRVLPLERPLLMGIVNATPDSFSDEGELPDTRGAPRPRARAAGRRGGHPRRRRRVRARRPPAGAGRGGDRARGAASIAGLAGRGRARLRRHPQARGGRGRRARRGRRSSTTSPGLRDPALAAVCARVRRRAGDHAHARGAEGHAARPRPLRRRRRRRRRVPARADGRRVAAGVAEEQILLDPARLRQDARADGRRAAAARRRAARSGGRCCWPSRARTSSAR